MRGRRYVDGGDHMASAGITSGMDAVLHYIAQHNGDAVAQVVARELHYPSYAFVDKPQVAQQSADAGLNLVGVLNMTVRPLLAGLAGLSLALIIGRPRPRRARQLRAS